MGKKQMGKKQKIICLDFESTLVPEFWPIAADELGIEELRLTTQEFPDFAELMKRRIEALNKHGVKLHDLVDIADTMTPIDGALEFIAKLKTKIPRIVILSDFAEQLAAPLIDKFGGLTFLGHTFDADPDGTITGYIFRQDNPKEKVVNALQSLNLEVRAAGDSYNDITMLESADKAFFIKSPEKIQTEFPQFKNTTSYNELYEWLTGE